MLTWFRWPAKAELLTAAFPARFIYELPYPNLLQRQQFDSILRS
jgi:hypothetical protein